MSGVRRLPVASLVTWAAVCLLLGGCGYVGEPLPPLLNIPQPVSDLRSIEHAGHILVEFTPPVLNTEGIPLKRLSRIELRIGPAPQGAFDAEAWAAGAKLYPDVPCEGNPVSYRVPAAEWVGREVVLAVNVIGPSGRPSGWSNFPVLKVIPPLPVPASLTATAVPEGVRLQWTGGDSSFRIYRSEPEGKPVEIARAEKAEWVDTRTRFGQRYVYLIQAVRQAGNENAESGISEPVEIVPKDTFPPAVPTGLTAVAGLESIELVWERNTEEDLQAYRVYRAGEGGRFTLVAGSVETPSFSDRTAEKGKSYRYAVGAVDRTGNESAQSPPVAVTFH